MNLFRRPLSTCVSMFIAVALTPIAATSIADNSQAVEPSARSLFQYKDTFNLEYASDPFFSPDGKEVYYLRRSANIMTDSTSSTLWKVDLLSGEHFPVLAQGASIVNPVLSPDGSKLAYVARHGRKSQIYVHYFASGTQAKLTNLTESPKNLTWSNRGDYLAFTLFTQTKPQSLFKEMPDKPKGAKWAPSATYIEKTSYRFDGSGYLPNGFDHVYLLPVSGGTPRQLTSGNYLYEGPLSFNKDDTEIILTAYLDEDFAMKPLEKDIYALSISKLTMKPLTDYAGPEISSTISPDGKLLAFLHTDDRKLGYQNGVLKVLDLECGSVKALTATLDRAIADVHWQNDSMHLVFSYLDKGLVKLARVSTDGKTTTLPASLGGTTLGRPYTSGSFAVSSQNDISFTKSQPTQPADLVLLGQNQLPQTLTDLNQDALGHLNLASVEKISVQSSVDKRPIDAWIAYPPKRAEKEKVPLILEIHGGPHAAYGPHFSAEIQLMAAKGYAVLWANPRGSASYGEEFGNLIHHNYPSEDYNDLMDAVDAAVATGKIDKDNLFITGGSGGGVLTAWSIGKTDRFKAAVVAKPVINWMSFALTADVYPYFTQYWMPGMPWEHHEHLWQQSPLSLVGNVTTPTLLLTGEEDHRTPISESEQYYQALRLKGVDAAMVRIPGSPHGIAAKPSRLIQKVGNIIAWFDRYRTAKEANTELQPNQ